MHIHPRAERRLLALILALFVLLGFRCAARTARCDLRLRQPDLSEVEPSEELASDCVGPASREVQVVVRIT